MGKQRKPKIGASPYEQGGHRHPTGRVQDHETPKNPPPVPQNLPPVAKIQANLAAEYQKREPHRGGIVGNPILPDYFVGRQGNSAAVAPGTSVHGGWGVASAGDIIEQITETAKRYSTRTTQEQMAAYQKYLGRNAVVPPRQAVMPPNSQRTSRPPDDPQAFDQWYRDNYMNRYVEPQVGLEYDAMSSRYILTARHGDGTKQAVAIDERALAMGSDMDIAKMFYDALDRIGARGANLNDIIATLMRNHSMEAQRLARAFKSIHYDPTRPDILSPESIQHERQETRLALRGEARAVRNRG